MSKYPFIRAMEQVADGMERGEYPQYDHGDACHCAWGLTLAAMGQPVNPGNKIEVYEYISEIDNIEVRALGHVLYNNPFSEVAKNQHVGAQRMKYFIERVRQLEADCQPGNDITGDEGPLRGIELAETFG